MATPDYNGTNDELNTALAHLTSARQVTAHLLTPHFLRVFDKLIHSIELRIYRRERDLAKEKMRRPVGRPRVFKAKFTDE